VDGPNSLVLRHAIFSCRAGRQSPVMSDASPPVDSQPGLRTKLRTWTNGTAKAKDPHAGEDVSNLGPRLTDHASTAGDPASTHQQPGRQVPAQTPDAIRTRPRTRVAMTTSWTPTPRGKFPESNKFAGRLGKRKRTGPVQLYHTPATRLGACSTPLRPGSASKRESQSLVKEIRTLQVSRTIITVGRFKALLPTGAERRGR